ncbi:hypothetical protein fh0823_06710 [Francisella halioticida]|nr:hypothetical protein fh0823_06710 [Francisella halioticida]
MIANELFFINIWDPAFSTFLTKGVVLSATVFQPIAKRIKAITFVIAVKRNNIL